MNLNYKKPDLKNRYYDDFLESIQPLNKLTIAITGTTSGTGFVAAQTVISKGAKVILLNRNSTRAIESYNQLKSKYPESEIYSIECDLQRFKSVRKAAKEVIEICPDGLSVLCNNAGVMALKDISTPDGFDVQMQTNHLSHFLLTKELFKCLKKAADNNGESRIVNHSSMARYGVKNLEPKYLEKNGGNLGGNGKRMMLFPQGRWKRYSQTKLANCAFTAALNDRLRNIKSNVKVFVAHPGLALTDLQQTTIIDGGMNAWMASQMMKSGQTQEDGAIGIIKCMTDPQLVSGTFCGPGAGKMSMKGPVISFDLEAFYNNQYTKDLLWTKSCQAIGEDFNIK
tara:strand:+ start:391 stop:1410 length:1020 start_codon:yes stop_codon:yes gene_type:complete